LIFLTKHITFQDLKQWLTEESRPLIWEFTAGNAQQIFGLDVKVHFLFFVTPEMEADDKVLFLKTS
jgi:hypothetical protein